MLWIEVLEQHLVWLRRPIQDRQSFHTEDKYNLSSVQFPDFAGFGTASLPQPAGQGSLQIRRDNAAPPASRLNTQMSRFPICGGPFLRPSDPACSYPCIAAVVSLWGAFPALILHTGDILESDRQPFSWRAQVNVDVTVSVMYTVHAKNSSSF